MSNFIDKIISAFKTKDELIGEWFTEDGSGFSIIMGSWIEFKSNGKGEYESWSNSKDDTGYDFNGKITWKRLSKNQIEITELGSFKKEMVNYKLQKINDRVELSNLEISKIGKAEIEEFWNFSQIMFRKK